MPRTKLNKVPDNIKLDEQLKQIRSGYTELKWNEFNKITGSCETIFIFKGNKYKVCIYKWIEKIGFYKYKGGGWHSVILEHFNKTESFESGNNIEKAKLIVQKMFDDFLLNISYRNE